jgi:Cft2 family RNA processing exonuclease
MRALRNLVIPAVVLLGSAGACLAQDKPDAPKVEPAKDDDGPEVGITKQVVEMLKSELELTEEQETKVTVVVQKIMREGMKNMMKHMGEENPDQDAIKKEQEDLKQSIIDGVKAELDEGQKKEFELFVKEFENRSGKWQRAGNIPGGDAAIWFEGELPTKERWLLKAENVLLLSEDEKKVVLPKVEAVIAARSSLRELRHNSRKDLQTAVHGGAKEEEVKERLHSLRERTEGLEKTLERAEEDLRELLAIDQEARLVAIGILD